jgi:hypothetical protein
MRQQLRFNIQTRKINDDKHQRKLKINEENQEQKMKQKLDLENQKRRSKRSTVLFQDCLQRKCR